MKGLLERQNELVSAVRDPRQSFTGLEDDAVKRLAIYQSLFFNNLNNFLINGFPVIHQLLNTEKWLVLVRRFFIEHQCESPYFSQISKEFVTYLSGQPDVLVDYPPFLVELAHYEWIELDVSIRDNKPVVYNTRPLLQTYSLSSLASVVEYRFPVHRLSVSFQPQSPSAQPHFFAVYRDVDDKVNFVELQPLTALLLSQIENADSPLSVASLEARLAEYLPIEQHQQVRQFLPQTLDSLVDQGIVIQH